MKLPTEIKVWKGEVMAQEDETYNQKDTQRPVGKALPVLSPFFLSIDFIFCLVGNMIRLILPKPHGTSSHTRTRNWFPPKREERGTKRTTPLKKRQTSRVITL